MMADDKKPVHTAPTPTQAENDEEKARLAGGKAKVEARDAEEPPEQLPPTPTQAENDAAKLAATGGEVPTDPTAPIDQGASAKRSVEADKPGGYSTRGAAPSDRKPT